MNAGKPGGGGAGGNAPGEGLWKIVAIFDRPENGGRHGVTRANWRDRFDAGGNCLPEICAGSPQSAAGAERKHDGLRTHRLDAAGGGDGAGASEQHGGKQMFGFLLVRSDDGGLGFDAAEERVAIGIEQGANVFLARAGDQLGEEIGWGAGRETAAEHEPGGGAEIGFDGGFDGVALLAVEARASFVELDGETVAVRDGEVEADVVADGDGGDGEAAVVHEFFKAGRGLAAGGQDSESLSAEAVDDNGGVDTASSGGVVGGQDVGAVIEREPIDGNRAVDRGVHSEGEYQIDMVAYGGIGSGRRRRGGWSSVNWEFRAVAQPG